TGSKSKRITGWSIQMTGGKASKRLMKRENPSSKASDVSIALGEDWPEIRASVQRIFEDFPPDYLRGLDEREEVPTACVQALTKAGYLGALIPEEYGGAGLPLRAAGIVLEECHAAGCYAAAAHAQMYTMGSVLRHGSAEQKKKYLPKIASGELRLQ